MNLGLVRNQGDHVDATFQQTGRGAKFLGGQRLLILGDAADQLVNDVFTILEVRNALRNRQPDALLI